MWLWVYSNTMSFGQSMIEKSKKFVFYVCPLCGNISETDNPHKQLLSFESGYEPELWCEGEVIKMGAIPFDDDEMDNLMDYYESRMNERAIILAKQIQAPNTLEDASAATMAKFAEMKKQSMANALQSYNQAIQNSLNQPLPTITAPPGNLKTHQQLQDEAKSRIVRREWEQMHTIPRKIIDNMVDPLAKPKKRWWKK